MANIIQIKRGENAPTIDVLEDYELGYCIDEKTLYINDNGTIRLTGLPLSGGNITGSLTIQGNDIYHEGNKPTKADIGLGNVNNWGATTSTSSTSTTTYATASAVKSAYDRGTAGVNAAATKLPLSGGTLTGDLNFYGRLGTTRGTLNNQIVNGTETVNYIGNPAKLTYIEGASIVCNGNNIYHEGNKPTKSDIGLGNVNNWGASSSVSSTSTTTYATSNAVKAAYDRGSTGITNAATKLPLSGGTMTGTLSLGNQWLQGAGGKRMMYDDGSIIRFGNDSRQIYLYSNTNDLYVNVGSDWNKLYHTGYTPPITYSTLSSATVGGSATVTMTNGWSDGYQMYVIQASSSSSNTPACSTTIMRDQITSSSSGQAFYIGDSANGKLFRIYYSGNNLIVKYVGYQGDGGGSAYGRVFGIK